jgi:ABC-2 type transport system permease protein
MKAIDIALKDMSRSFRSAFAVIFMFGIPLLVTGMFYFMFGNIASGGDFNLPRTRVVVADLDEGGPKFQVNTKNIPGGKDAHTMGQLIVGILQSEKMSDLIEVSLVPDAAAAHAAVDRQAAQVALVIPADFSKQFADLNGKAVIEFYQDPTLTIGPSIIRSIMNRFMDGMSSVKIAVNVFLDEADPKDSALAGLVVDEYLHISLAQSDDPEKDLIDVRSASSVPVDPSAGTSNLLLRIIGPIMAGMMVFYAFYTGTSTAQSILKEEEERTLPRLFTTPTSQATILTGKFLAVFMTVLVQIVVLIIASHLIFGIQWGKTGAVALVVAGTVFSASSFGIFVNSFLKTTRQGGAVFGGVLTVTGMLGMVSIFASGSPTAAVLTDTVSLLVPQGWAVRGLQQVMNGQPLTSAVIAFLGLLAWAVVFFIVGVLRFNKRYV